MAPKKSYHHGDLKRALITAARGLVEKKGAAALTLRAAARAAGVTHAAPYRHFEDKAGLLAAVAAEGFVELGAAMAAARERAGDDPDAGVRAMGVSYVRFAVDHTAHFRVMFGAVLGERAKHPELDAAAAKSFGMLIEGIGACQAIGSVRKDNPRDVALSAWSLLHGLASLIVEGQLGLQNDEIEPVVRRAQSLLYEGIEDRIR